MTPAPKITLNNGVQIPQLGFGLWQVPAEQATELVSAALETGYRHIDTAAAYGNEEAVGKAIAASGVPREEIFVTTKLWNGDHGVDKAMRAFDQSLRNLGLETLDLYLIHWPVPKFDQYVDTWKVMEKIYAEGRVRAIGVSNFNVEHLERILEESGTVPAVNQIELHPRLPQQELRAFNEAHGIHTEAWSPIGQGRGLLDDPVIAEIAAGKGKSPAQVVLRWHVQLGNIVFPKSVHVERIRENFQIFDFELDAAEMERLNSMGRNERLGPDPSEFNAR